MYLTLHKDPVGVLGRERHKLTPGISLQHNISEIFPYGFDSNCLKVLLNGVEIDPLEFDLNRITSLADRLDIVMIQKGLETATIGWIIAAVTAVASAAFIALTPRPDIPNDSGSGKTSSNNQLTQQTNIARAYQAIPDIYGRVRAYPDLIQPSLSEYINNEQLVTEWMCVGIGEYLIERVKYANTLLSTISGASYQIFKPGDIIPQITEAFAVDDVNGQEITPPNLGNSVIYSASSQVVIDLELSGEFARVKIPYSASFDRFSDAEKPLNVKVEVDIKAPIMNSAGQIVSEIRRHSMGAIIEHVESIEGHYVFSLSGINYSSIPVNAEIQNTYFSLSSLNELVVGPFILPTACDQIWYNILYPRGINGWVVVWAEWWDVDVNNNEIPGTRQNHHFIHYYESFESQRFTMRITPATGRARRAFQMWRSNNGKEDLTDQIKLESLYAIRFRHNVIAEDTLIKVTTRATNQATGFKDKKFNIDVTRKTISYNRNTGQIDYTLRPSRSFADAVLHSFVIIAGRDPSELDIDELYRIDADIKSIDERLGYHDFSYDDKDISLGQRLQAICNSARVTTFRDGQRWCFVRNELKPYPVVQFDGRNLAADDTGGSIQYKAQLPTSYDGVELEYVDSTDANEDGTDKKAYIWLKINRETGEITEGQSERPYKMQLAGCRNRFQAMNRAQLEVRQLLYQRVAVEDTALSDAYICQLGDRVRWVDIYDEAVISGEILGFDDNVFYTSEDIELDPNETYHASITDKYGYPSTWLRIEAVPNQPRSFSADFDNAFIADHPDVSVGSRFIITVEKEADAMDFILTDRKPSDDDKVNINLTLYDDRIYEYDQIQQASLTAGFFNRENNVQH